MLVSENLNVVLCKTKFDGTHLASGVYLYRLQAGRFSETKKLMVVE